MIIKPKSLLTRRIKQLTIIDINKLNKNSSKLKSLIKTNN